MTFATPLLAAIAAAIAIPALVILYFLKLRRRSVEVSTTLLWRKSIEDLQANAPFQKLRKNILLLLQLLALIAALLAIAQPRSDRIGGAPRRHVLLIDRSATMNALDGGRGSQGGGVRTRLEAAKRVALERVEALREGGVLQGAGDEAMVIAFDGSAEVVQRFTADKRALREAIERIEPTDVPGSIAEAFTLAEANRPRSGSGAGDEPETPTEGGRDAPASPGQPQTFEVFSDGRFADGQRFNPRAGDEVIYHAAGTPEAANAGITALRAERAFDDPSALSVFVGLQNASDAARTVEVELLVEGRTLAIRETTLPAARAASTGADAPPSAPGPGGEPGPGAAGGRRSPGGGGLVFELNRSEGGVAEIRLRSRGEQGDALPTDDVGRLVIPPAKRSAVAVVTEGNLFLAEALGGLPLERLETYTPPEFAALGDAERAAFDVVVLDGVLPSNVPDGRALPPGRWLVLGVVPEGPEALSDAGETEGGRFLDWSRGHPALRGLTLSPVYFASARDIEIPEDSLARVIASTTQGPGIVEIAAEDYRAIVTSFRPAESNWPFDVGFVVFLASSIRELSGSLARTGETIERNAPPGRVLTDRVPAHARSLTLRGPDGARTPLTPGADGRVSFGPLKRTGLYTLDWDGPSAGERRYAVNLLSPRSTDVAASGELELADRVAAGTRGERAISTRRYWPWLLVAALAVMLLEWWIYNRRVYL